MLQDFNIDNVNILGDAIDFSISMDARQQQREKLLKILGNSSVADKHFASHNGGKGIKA